MKKIIIVSFLTFIWGFIPGHSQAQNWEASFDFMLGAPQGDFSNNVNALGYGIDLLGAYQITDSPIALGMDLGFLIYGTSRRSEPFSPNIPEVTVRVNTTNNIAFGHFLARIQPGEGRIRPFIDGLIGFNYLFTESTIRDERTNEDIAGSTNFDDITFSSGIAAGAKFHLFETIEPESGRLIRIYLNLRTRYLMGGEAEYLKRGSIRSDNGNLLYDVERSRTDILTFHLGFGVRF